MISIFPPEGSSATAPKVSGASLFEELTRDIIDSYNSSFSMLIASLGVSLRVKSTKSFTWKW